MSEVNVVNKLTLTHAIVGLVKATGNFNHFLATPQGTTAMVDHLNDTRKWWPDYSTYFTDARIRILLAVRVAKQYFPDLEAVYPQNLGKQRVAGDVFRSCLARMEKESSDEEAIPPNVKDVWNTQAYWEAACEFANTIQLKRNEAHNLEVERKKNPGHFKVAGQWVPYGSVFKDGQGQEMVAINHTVLPLALVESRGQGFENSLAVMPLEKAQPAINRINELGGNMFAAICRVGFAEIEQLVAECGEIDVRDVAMKRDRLADPVSAGNLRNVDGVTYEQYDLDPKLPTQDRVANGWLNPWDLSNPFREGGPLFVTWDEVKELDKDDATRVGGKRHWHSSQIVDGDEKGEISLDYVIIRPHPAEKYKSVVERLKELRANKANKQGE